MRLGNTVGIHEVMISTGTQTLTLKHEAHDRVLLAQGALDAAAFLQDKAPGLYHGGSGKIALRQPEAGSSAYAGHAVGGAAGAAFRTHRRQDTP